MGIISSVASRVTEALEKMQGNPPPEGDPAVELVCATLPEAPIRLRLPTGALAHESLEAKALVRNRAFWKDVQDTGSSLAQTCMLTLLRLGVPDASAFQTLAAAGTIQVTLPPDCDRNVALFPWEFYITEATRSWRHALGGRKLLIFRHLPSASPLTPDLPRNEPPKVQVVVSSPGDLRNHYSFDAEKRLIFVSLDASAPGGYADDATERTCVGESVTDPDVTTLAQEVGRAQPDVLHITCIDNHQGASILNPQEPPDRPRPEGIYLRDTNSNSNLAVQVPFEDVVEAITGAKDPTPLVPPGLVSFNCYNSSFGAFLAVKEGARLGIGFQDEIDDALAEQFFVNFYRQLILHNWQPLEALRGTWEQFASPDPRLRGTGIVMYAGVPLIGEEHTLEPKRDALAQSEIEAKNRAAATVVLPKDITGDPQEYLDVDFAPMPDLNYSLLHNNEPMFQKFTIRALKEGTYHGIKVQVVLNVGDESPTFQAVYSLKSSAGLGEASKLPIGLLNLLTDVRISLTSSLARSIVESIFTSLYVQVTWGPHVLYERTERVRLLPCDEWLDDARSRHWLPSFVSPRDPTVRKIVDDAQRYLTVLTDDDAAGFSGYQSVFDTTITPEEGYARVDAQVQAIWWTLVQDYRLAYINPPPTFSIASQRLRTPTDVITGRRGTCIDLALLLSACLEYVQIDALVFLMKGHAFVGYLRGRGRVADMAELRGELHALYQSKEEGVAASERIPWNLPRDQWNGVLRLILNGTIVPLETTLIPQRKGFLEAVLRGTENLQSQLDFEGIYDISRSRERVTPLPIWSRDG